MVGDENTLILSCSMSLRLHYPFLECPKQPRLLQLHFFGLSPLHSILLLFTRKGMIPRLILFIFLVCIRMSKEYAFGLSLPP